jgi:predicted naringenin-chalcone synthase
LSIKDDATSNKNRDIKRLEIFQSNQQLLKKPEEGLGWYEVGENGRKTIISDDNHQDLKKD